MSFHLLLHAAQHGDLYWSVLCLSTSLVASASQHTGPCCRKYGQCVTNNNGDTGFVTALIFSVVTEQTIGLSATSCLVHALLMFGFS